MSAYYILTHTITDPERYQREYIVHATPILMRHHGEIVVATFKAEPLQGSPPEGVVVARFPSEEHIRAFVNDPEYQPLKEIRLALTTNASALLAPEFVMPSRDS